MRLSAERSSKSGALLTVAGPCGFALPAAYVLGIEPLHDWQGEAPLDVLPLLGIEAPGLRSEEQRVALVDAGERRLPLLVRGALTLIHPAANELLPLPPAMRALSPFITHIAVINGKPSLFVLSPARLAHAPAAATSALPFASR